MSQRLKAIYRNGTLVLDQQLSIANGNEVSVVVIADNDDRAKAKRLEDKLSEIAALPSEGKGEKFSGRDHDRILYGRTNDK